MKKLIVLFAAAFAVSAFSQDLNPRLEFVLDLKVALEGGAINVGTVPEGGRTIIPITGGTFEGPNIRGEVMSGGADYQLHSATTQLTQVNAIYSLRTDDGVDIFIQNEGVIARDGYFFTAPKFQAPVDSKYAWLNNSIYVCRPIGFWPGINLRVWRVCDANGREPISKEFNPVPQEIFKEASKKGKIEEFKYEATVNGKKLTKHAHVYLPYGYNAKDKSKKYNIVYLIHGGGDNTMGFYADPRSPLPLTNVLDHLNAEGKMDPVIVVCPTFYYDDLNIGENKMDDAIELTRIFHKELHDYLIPAVETNYNTYYKDTKDIEATRDHRAFGGFSMGALTTWYQLAYGNDDVKHFIPLSGDLWIYDKQGDKLSADVAACWLTDRIENSKHPNDFIVYGYTGDGDIAYQPEKALFESLREHSPLFRINAPDGNATFVVKKGGVHYYGDVNEYLYEILPLIWK